MYDNSEQMFRFIAIVMQIANSNSEISHGDHDTSTFMFPLVVDRNNKHRAA